MSWVQELKLQAFRCYTHLSLKNLEKGLVVLHGANGAGKTNVLEALSMLSPGKGLRGAKVTDMQLKGGSVPWAISTRLNVSSYPVQVGTGLDATTGKRRVKIEGDTVRSQGALGEYVSCVWLTPQMDRLFLDSASHRRRFLDRLVFTFDPGHSGRVTRYENAMRQRSKLLQSGQNKGRAPDPAWLSALEAQMAETGVAIAAARLDFAERLQAACERGVDQHFPKARLRVKGTVEEILQQNGTALEVEQMFQYQLRESRGVDMLTGGAATGPHKADLQVFMADNNMPASQCSTGEQKALLIGMILAHARLIAAERGRAPLLLLDEVAAHLDENRRAALYHILSALGSQVWLTGADASLFDSIRSPAQFFEVKDASVKPHNYVLKEESTPMPQKTYSAA